LTSIEGRSIRSSTNSLSFFLETKPTTRTKAGLRSTKTECIWRKIYDRQISEVGLTALKSRRTWLRTNRSQSAESPTNILKHFTIRASPPRGVWLVTTAWPSFGSVASTSDCYRNARIALASIRLCEVRVHVPETAASGPPLSAVFWRL
jgi:hypothetical protein